MKPVAVIPARGGSQRIPHKNIRPFMGKPVIAYSISAARETALFDEVIVSTDDSEIAAVAEQYGASVPFVRPAELADDQTGVMEVVAHTVQHFTEQGMRASDVCVIYAAAPLIRHQDIIDAYRMLCSGNKDFVLTGTAFSASIFRAFTVNSDGTAKMFWTENYSKNSQDFPEAYHDAAQFFWGRADAFLRESPLLFSDKTAVFQIPHYRAVDIDTLDDWRHAELLYKALRMEES